MTTRREIQKLKRDIRRKALNLDDMTEDSKQRNYTKATKTRRAVKTEMFGNRSKGKDTYLEEYMTSFLKKHDIDYIPQKAVRWCNYDFYLPKYNTLIECQGEYWHCDHRLYDKPKNAIQRKNIVKNETKRDIAQKEDIFLIEVWENEIKNFPDETEKGLLHLFGLEE